MLRDSELNLPKRKIAYLFGLSKQTVVEDNTARGIFQAERLVLVEFLEFIGRLAFFKFLGTEYEENTLGYKIGTILDEIFVTIKVERNNPPEPITEFHSSSEED